MGTRTTLRAFEHLNFVLCKARENQPDEGGGPPDGALGYGIEYVNVQWKSLMRIAIVHISS